MGVKGLWKLISESGIPVPLETLEHKILGVDVSIWLHQAIHGCRREGSNSITNTQLQILFHRICKLLFYRIKPVFIFDGGIPELKRQTLSSRRLKRDLAAKKATKIKERLLLNLLKRKVLKSSLGKKEAIITSHKRETDLFELPPLSPENLLSLNIENINSGEEEDNKFKKFTSPNLHEFELENKEFKSLPLEIQHEVLSELQDTRKENSWCNINEMPQESRDFSSFQMGRLLKRRKFQISLDDVRDKIRKNHAAEIESQLFGELEKHVSLTHRIVSEDNSHSILIKNIEENEHKDLKEITEMQEKKSLTKQDFLNELSKRGVIQISQQGDSNKNYAFSSHSDDEVTSNDSEDNESHVNKMESSGEEEIFLKAFDSILIDNQLTQEELITIIEQSKDEAFRNLNLPSTSKAPEYICSDNLESSPSTSKVPEYICNDNLESSPSISKVPEYICNDNLESSPLTSKVPEYICNDNLESSPSTSKVPEYICNDNLESSPSTSKAQEYICNDNLKSSPSTSKAQEYICNDNSESSPSISKAPEYICNDNLESSPSTSKAPEYICSDNSESSEEDDFIDVPLVESDKMNPDSRSLPFCSNSSEIINSQTVINKKNTSKNNTNYDDKLYKSEGNKLEYFHYDELKIDSFNNANININGDSQIHLSKNENINNNELHNSSIKKSIFEQNEHLSDIENSSKILFEIPLNEKKLDLEQNLLIHKAGNYERIAAELSNNMYLEAQELLKIFGIPYIVAPMEAEAQCAFLDMVGLTHGTITNDSDIFLFGGKNVYKNFFNKSKYIEFFQIKNIESNFGIDREKMINLALLTGSDYTVGVDSIGIVLAMEILAEFPGQGIECLKNLKKELNDILRSKSNIKKKLESITLPKFFPNEKIFNAYLYPTIDDSRETFSWGVPNIEKLREFTATKFGWSTLKTDEVLIPLFKKLEINIKQTRIDSYFTKMKLIKENKIKSKRLNEAILRSKTKSLSNTSGKIGITKVKCKSNNKVSQSPITTNKKKLSLKKPLKSVKKPLISSDDVAGPSNFNSIVTKEDKKMFNFEKLLEKEKISQLDMHEVDMERKKMKAVTILSKGKKSKKTK